MKYDLDLNWASLQEAGEVIKTLKAEIAELKDKLGADRVTDMARGVDNLIARLEKATEGSDDLDWAVAEEVHAGWILGKPDRYTQSLDAALTLVPEGWSFRLWRHPGEHGCHCDVYLLGEFNDGERPCLAAEDAEQCPTPALALALCIAALKARRAGQ